MTAHWDFLRPDQQSALRREFPAADGYKIEELRLRPYNESCHICGGDPVKIRWETQVDRLWVDFDDTVDHGTKVICIDRPACRARVSIKAQEAENIAKEIARRVEV